jgi:hypothetical protein
MRCILSVKTEPLSWLEHNAELGGRQASGAMRRKFYKGHKRPRSGMAWQVLVLTDAGVSHKIPYL